MTRTILILILNFLTIISYGQTPIQTKEVKVRYENGYAVFNVCTSGCLTNFDNEKEYFWYTEFSKVKSTKGGSGGNLLHGNFKFYDEKGNLRNDKNFYLGLRDGSEKVWDSLGKITEQIKWKKDVFIYWKRQNEEKYWVEWNGEIHKEGSVKKVYTQYNTLVSEETILPNFWQRVRTFYENSGKLKEDYTSDILGKYMKGKYTSYFENGKIEIEGQFDDGEYTFDIKIGTWKWYKPDGALNATETHKAEVEKWNNGTIKMVGGYVLDTENNAWVKTGRWTWYTEEGKIKSMKEYELGIVVEED